MVNIGDMTIQGQAALLPNARCVALNWDFSNATQTQAITGLGFKPSAIMIHIGHYNTFSSSVGWSSQDYPNGSNMARFSATADRVNFGQIVNLTQTAGVDYMTATISSYDTDGFTISWVRTGTPTGQLNGYFMAFK